MAKVDDATVTGNSIIENITNTYTASGTSSSSETTGFNQTITGVLLGYKLLYITSTRPNAGALMYVYINNTKVTTWSATGSSEKYSDYYTGPGTANNAVKTTAKSNSSNTGDIQYKFIYYVLGEIAISKTTITHLGLPRENKYIGSKATTTLFGQHIDNTRYTGENE